MTAIAITALREGDKFYDTSGALCWTVHQPAELTKINANGVHVVELLTVQYADGGIGRRSFDVGHTLPADQIVRVGA